MQIINNNFIIKGYNNDAGVDLLLPEDLYILPFETKIIDVVNPVKLSEREVGLILPRTSAAKAKLYVASCPIDPDYYGPLGIIVTNLHHEAQTFKQGTAISQLIVFRFEPINAKVKKRGTRTDSRFGKTGK